MILGIQMGPPLETGPLSLDDGSYLLDDLADSVAYTDDIGTLGKIRDVAHVCIFLKEDTIDSEDVG